MNACLATPAPLRVDLCPLRFVQCEDRYSVYDDGSDTYVYLEHGTGRVLVNVDDIDDLDQYLRAWRDTVTVLRFEDWLAEKSIEPDRTRAAVTRCRDCRGVLWRDGSYTVITVEGDSPELCVNCFDQYPACVRCDRAATAAGYDGDNRAICAGCIDDFYTWCADCQLYIDTDADGAHSHHLHGGCESPALEFTIRNDGRGPLANDWRVMVGLGRGVISTEGISAIADLLGRHSNALPRDDVGLFTDEARLWLNLSTDMYNEELGTEWQTKRGNFPKRFSAYAHQTYGLKISPEMMSEIGNIGRDHSLGSDYFIEVTRQLNQSPEAFYNGDSCWWGGYANSRCALKTNGGFGLRTFSTAAPAEDEGDYEEQVTGRAWVMPLRREHRRGGGPDRLVPTFDTMQPDAFIVFNGYGSLEGYPGGRIMAYLSGWTYRRVRFSVTGMFVNGDVGHLVGPQDLVEQFSDGIELWLEKHSGLYETEHEEMAHV